jgi:hypothetical protein
MQAPVNATIALWVLNNRNRGKLCLNNVTPRPASGRLRSAVQLLAVLSQLCFLLVKWKSRFGRGVRAHTGIRAR